MTPLQPDSKHRQRTHRQKATKAHRWDCTMRRMRLKMRFLRLPVYVLAALVAVASVAYGEVTRVDVTSRKPVGSSGYEKIVGVAHFAVESEGPAQPGDRRHRQGAGECQRSGRIFGRCGHSSPARRLEIQRRGARRRRESWAQDDHDDLRPRRSSGPGVGCRSRRRRS